MFTDQLLISVFTLFACLIAVIYWYVRYAFSYWERRGIPYIKPAFPFGNFGKTIRQKLSPSDLMVELYRSTTEPFIGAYILQWPVLIVRSPQLISNILIKDFQYFMNRDIYMDESSEPLSANLSALEGDRWKNLRTKLTSAFTSSKMQAVFPTILNCKTSLFKHIDKTTAQNEAIDVRELAACYTINIVASVLFGIDVDCFTEPNNLFRVYGRKHFEPTVKNGIRFFGWLVCPKLLKLLGISLIDRDFTEFLFDVVKQSIEMREKNDVVRKDLFQLLVKLRNSNSDVIDDEFKTTIANENSKSLTLEQIAAQVFIFYIAGYESSSGTISFCLYEIAKNPEIQRKLQSEIDEVMAKSNNELTYESIQEMKYLECCIDETLRKYSVVPNLGRVCVKDYKVPGTNVTLTKGTSVLIPAFAIQHDEKFYPDPEKFNPSRFLSENKSGKTFIDMPYMPFGEGPRNCIGQRLAKLMVGVGIASILQKYHIELDDQNIEEQILFNARSIALTPQNEINLKFKARN